MCGNVVLVVCYNRPQNLVKWLDAWQRMETTGHRLIFILTGDLPQFEQPPWLEVIRTDNAGYSTGAIKRFIDFRNDWEKLIWMPDDFLPLKEDLLHLYEGADVVGTFWSTTHHPHIRTGGISITKPVAKELKFPLNLLLNVKEDEYAFEYGDYCFYDQVVKIGCSVKMLDGTIPPESPHWEDVSQDFVLDEQCLPIDGKTQYICPF